MKIPSVIKNPVINSPTTNRSVTNRVASNAIYTSVEQLEEIRQLCLHDLYFLLRFAMNREDVDNDWCFARCREVQQNPDGYLDLWAREHYKSTIITVALTIQDILKNPEITVGIFSHTRPIAKAFLRQIKREFETNLLLQELFPHIKPPQGKTFRSWSEESGIVVERQGNPKEATIEAWGLIDSQPTGKHFSLLVYDDIVTLDSISNPEMVQKVTQAWSLSLNLGAHGGKRRHIGTRYHFNDTYKTIMERKSAKARVYAATKDGSIDGEPYLLDKATLLEKRYDMGAYVFGCQMLQNPKADKAQGFLSEWFLRVGEDIRWQNLNRYIVVDPAGEKKKTSDYTVMWVVGLGEDGNYYVIDGVRDRLNLGERAKALFRLHRLYKPLAVGYEKYGQQADIEYIQEVMSREAYHFPITPLGGSVAKNDRIKRLVPLFEGGRMYFKERIITKDYQGALQDLTSVFVEQEYDAFPVSRHDDMLDCLARIVEPALNTQFPQTQLGLLGTGSQAGIVVNGVQRFSISDYNPYA